MDKPDFGPGPDPELDFTPEDWADAYPEEPTRCPRCDGELTIDAADPSVGIMYDAVYCENDLPDGSACGWGEGETP
jgi:hypothetical protein